MKTNYTQTFSARWPLLAVLICIASLAGCASVQSQLPSGGPPIAYVAEPNHSIGTIMTGDLVEHYFTVANKGKSPLILTPSSGG